MTAFGRRYYRLPFDLRTCGFAAGIWALAVASSRFTASLDARAGLEASIATAALLLWACRLLLSMGCSCLETAFQKRSAYAAD